MNVLWGSRLAAVYFSETLLPHFWQTRPEVGYPARTQEIYTMTWIRTLSLAEADEKLRKAIEGEKAFYPKEYAEPVHPDASGASSIVGSHTLIPDALYHAFATFGALMSPELPLNRRQHEMIATMVSVTNRCVY